MRGSATLLAVALLVGVSAAADGPGKREWVEISVFCQCCTPPWGKSETDIRPFFQRNGIHVYNYRKEGRIVCAACSCPSDVKQLILVGADDVAHVREVLARSGQPMH